MSDHIPFDIQLEIIPRLPVKSLIRFRSLSKSWKSFIDSSEFIAAYSIRNSQQQHQCIRYGVCGHYYEYVLIADDDTFPMHKKTLTVPESIKLLDDSIVVGSSCGLFCILRYYNDLGDSVPVADLAVIWNPSIRKSVAFHMPSVVIDSFESVVFFGVCVNTSDPKIVKLKKIHMDTKNLTRNWQVEIFTLSSRVWRSPYCDLPNNCYSQMRHHDAVVVDGFMYWSAVKIFGFYEGEETIVIISFDLTSEEFREIYLPDKLSGDVNSHKYKLRESLAVVQSKMKADNKVYKVWFMDKGDSKSFTKLFTINIPHLYLSKPRGFANNGQLIMKMRNYGLVVYEPCTQQINDLEI